MHLQPLTVLAAVALGTVASASVIPTPTLIDSAQKREATSQASPPKPVNTKDFTATLMSNAEDSSCWLEVALPDMGCWGKTGKIMEFGHAQPELPEACWVKPTSTKNDFFVNTNDFCGSALLLVNSDGQVSVQNKDGQSGNFHLDTVEHGDVVTVSPGPLSLRSVD